MRTFCSASALLLSQSRNLVTLISFSSRKEMMFMRCPFCMSCWDMSRNLVTEMSLWWVSGCSCRSYSRN